MNVLKGNVIFFVCAAALAALSAPCLGNSSETNSVRIHPEKWHVHVVNNLSPGKILFAHCKSKDDDIGDKSLVPGAEFAWSFRVNFFGTTKFWCYMHTDNKHSSFDVFWVEGASNWLQYRCSSNNCIWTAKDDGIYIKIIPEDRDELIHKWEQ